MNVFLSELSKEYPYDKIALIMDGAGWHKSKDLKVPKNIVIFYFPPYSPELNPVERLWFYIKSNILSNRIYEKLEDLEMKLCEFMNQLEDEAVKNICTLEYIVI
jgi:transposase